MKINVYADLHKYALVSSITTEALKKVSKYKPDALFVKDSDGNPVFGIGMGATGCVAANGVTFNDTTAEGGFAMASFDVPADMTDMDKVKAYIADRVGAAEARLTALENALPAVIAEIDASRAAIMNGISVI